jgi:hypothetical protein
LSDTLNNFICVHNGPSSRHTISIPRGNSDKTRRFTMQGKPSAGNGLL